jgi:predicted 2-oxoglutarate/Fe(II)-dependent dioxygenase YbiX
MCAIADLNHADAAASLAVLPRQALDERERLIAIFHAGADEPRRAEIGKTRRVFAHAPAAGVCGRFAPPHTQGRWILFDPSLRVVAAWPLARHAEALAAFASTPSPDLYAGTPIHAPALIVPRIFETDFCKRLIRYYQERGGAPSGVTRENEAGKTVVQLDAAAKRRFDCLIEDVPLREEIMQRVYWRLAPQIEKAFMWRPTRMERYLLACYDAEGGGFFRPHRDNTTAGTAHRRFAVTINLNAEDYEGGDLRFPEFGTRTYRAPTGGAVVFACALLHEATLVTRGERYAFLPFLYDDDAAQIRAANNERLDESIAPYKS